MVYDRYGDDVRGEKEKDEYMFVCSFFIYFLQLNEREGAMRVQICRGIIWGGGLRCMFIFGDFVDDNFVNMRSFMDGNYVIKLFEAAANE